MTRRPTSFPAVLALSALGSLAFGGCSGGGSEAGRASAFCAGSSFCLTDCSLGCTVSGGCSINSIAQNQPIMLNFSEPVDPSSVNAATISLKTANGEAPTGSFEVAGSQIRFRPEVRIVADLPRGLRELRADGIRSLLCEGGPTLNSTLFEAGLVDELFLTVAPTIAGAGEALTIVEGPPLPAPVGVELLTVHEADGHLFLRYRVAHV